MKHKRGEKREDRMKGLELARRYYEEVGREVIKREAPEAFRRLAAGLAGAGSECFGFDDTYSRDHDFGPSFCLWLTREDYARYGEILERCYQNLPGDFAGFPKRLVTPEGKGRVGVLIIEEFFEGLTGRSRAPEQITEWFALSENGLAAAVNGQIFEDHAGIFTARREEFLAYYPEEVRRRKMAQEAVLAAQGGQYNYARMMKRGDTTAAAMAEHVFMEHGMQLIYLLNRRYAPFYKWIHRGIKELPLLSETGELFARLAALPVQEAAWQSGGENYRYGLNMADEKVVCMETICALIVREFGRQGLSTVQDNYLEAHAGAILQIK